MRAFVITFAAFALFGMAKAFAMPVAQPTLEEDIRRLETLADTGTNGGDVSINTYSEVDFDYQKEVRELFEDVNGSQCRYTTDIGRRQFMRSVSAYVIFENSPEAIEILDRLYASGKIRAALGYTWDRVDGFPEYCSTEQIELFFTNGERLIIFHDSTT